MRAAGILRPGLIALAGVWVGVGGAAPADPPATTAPVGGGAGFPGFKVQEIDDGLKIGYAVLIADINGDQKPDIVVVDQFQVVWYENPGKDPGTAAWQKRVILGEGKTKPDNVCAAAVDIDGDGRLDLVLGAGWKPFDTATPGTLQWLKRGKTLDEEWTMYPIPCDEPTVHRVRAFDTDGDGKPEIVHVPLMGRDATAKGNWLDGRPVRVIAYQIPKDPEKPESWKPQVLSDELHVTHNFYPVPNGRGNDILLTSYEGVYRLHPGGSGGKWVAERVGEGNQANPAGNRGASEIKMSADGRQVVATIEPWHGNQVVTYTKGGPGGSYTRHVIDQQLRWGHAVWFADLDGDRVDELIIGVRDDPNPKQGDTHTQRRGVRIYKATDGKGAMWEGMLLDEGGVAVEDLAAGDLDGDGDVDIVACGRATKNVRIYWNQGK